MTVALPQLAEIHSSDLTARCLREVYHRHAGEVDAECPTAMYRGNIAGEALRMIRMGEWDGKRTSDGMIALASRAADAVDGVLVAENRPASAGAQKARTEIIGEVARHVGHYLKRVPADNVSRVIGCEVPVRCTFMVDGEAIEFASHLDYVWRSTSGLLVVDDDKWREDQPTWEYLRRNEQFACYAYACRHGELLVGGEWIEFREWPLLRWIDLANFKPYTRKTVCGDGEEYAKGDDRPLDKLIRHVPYDDVSGPRIEAMVAERVRMMRAGLWPANSDPIGCQVCQSKRYCVSYDAGSDQ